MIEARAIKSLRPGASWMVDGDTLDGLKWLDESTVQPTRAEIEAEVARLAVLDAEKKVADEKRKKFEDAEGQITARRLREAVLTQAGRDWLAAKDAEISALRGQA